MVAFWPDMPPFNPDDDMTIYRDSGKGFQQYRTDSGVQLEATERILVWARMSGDEIVGGVRWTPYIVDNDVDTIEMRPLREVIAPRVVYDRTSNTLSLWFWTDVNESYTGTVYDEDELYPITALDGFQTGFQSNNRAKRVLCYAIGEFYHSYLDGGLVSGYQSTGQGIQTDERWDLVPVFARPRILNWTQNDNNAAGVAVDGVAGIQVRLVHDMRFTGGSFQARYKDVMVLADLYTSDWVDIFGTATCPTQS